MKEIINRYHRIKILKDTLSEIDIQTLLIEPIISHGGWNLYNPNEVKRAGRSSNGKEFDIEIYDPSNNDLKIAIECKSLKNHEFNIDKIGNGIGALLRTKEKGIYEQQKSNDGVAQLRRYCIRSSLLLKQNALLPILTNGYEWVIFNSNFFKDDTKFNNNIDQNHIFARETIVSTQFKNKIIAKLKK